MAHKLVENGQQQVSQGALDEWLMQGVSIALGRYVHGTISNRRALYEKLAAIHEFHEAKHLLRQADVLLQRAATAETKPSGDYALELLASQRKLLADELAVLDAAASDPARRKALKMTESTLRAAKRFAQDQIAQMSSDDIVKLPIHVGGMQEIVDGQLRGSRAEIARTIIAAKRAHIEVSGKPDADGEWRAITIGAKSYKVHERKYDPQQWAEHAGAVDGKYKSSVKQADAIEAVKHGASTKEQRELLANEIVRQVPGVGLKIAVADGARTVISVVTPGGGRLGIKKLNDKLLGHALTDVLIAERNKVLVSVFAKHEMGVIVSGYKTMTLTSKKPPNELGTAIKDGLAEFDSLMKPKLQAVLEQGVDYWKNELATKSKRSKEYADAKERVQGLEKALADIEKGELSFSVQLGAAEIAGGKSASYEQILSAEMNASKAAIMARGEKQADGSPVQRTSGMVYSEKGFRDFAIETMKIRDDLQGKRLVWNGKPRRVFGDDGLLDTDIARAARKDQIDPQKSGDPKTLEKLKTFMERVNTLDFLSRTKSEDLADFGPQVEQAATMVTKLRKGSVIEGDAQAISQTLKGSVAQDGTASEAGFHNRAAVRKDRTVLNADILDLGVDVLQGNIKAMERIQKGGNVDAVSRGASDDIIKMKARIVKDLETFYRDEILPAAQREIVKQKRDDLAHLLDAEQQPLFLLGGDEITISVPRAFEELGLLPLLVTHLQTKARARVAITRTGATQDGARGHQRAMRQAESAHEALKSYEQLARDLSDYADKLPAAEKHQARELVVFLQTLYTSTSDGRVDVVSRTGPADVTERVKKAEKLLEKARGRD